MNYKEAVYQKERLEKELDAWKLSLVGRIPSEAIHIEEKILRAKKRLLEFDLLVTRLKGEYEKEIVWRTKSLWDMRKPASEVYRALWNSGVKIKNVEITHLHDDVKYRPNKSGDFKLLHVSWYEEFTINIDTNIGRFEFATKYTIGDWHHTVNRNCCIFKSRISNIRDRRWTSFNGIYDKVFVIAKEFIQKEDVARAAKIEREAELLKIKTLNDMLFSGKGHATYLYDIAYSGLGLKDIDFNAETARLELDGRFTFEQIAKIRDLIEGFKDDK